MTRAARIARVALVGLASSVAIASVTVAATLGLGPGARLSAAGVFLAAVAVFMVVALVRGSLAQRRAAVVVLCGGYAVFSIAQALAPDPLSTPWLPRQLPFLIVGALAAAYGVAARRPWGRWLTLGAGWAGVMGFAWLGALWVAFPGAAALWGLRTLLFLAGSVLLVVGLHGREMRACFAGPLAGLAGARAGLLRASVLLGMASVPYLLMYGLGDPGMPVRADQLLALGDAALLVAAAMLVIRQRTVGLLVSVAAAAGVSVFAVRQLAGGMTVYAWWSATLLPAVLGAIVGVAAVAGPAWRRLRG